MSSASEDAVHSGDGRSSGVAASLGGGLTMSSGEAEPGSSSGGRVVAEADNGRLVAQAQGKPVS